MATKATTTIEPTTPDEVSAPAAIQLERLGWAVYHIPIVGVTSLITQRWSEKSRTQMLTKQQTKARAAKEPRDPEANFEAARYRLRDGSDGMPATAFKAAIVHAARLFSGVTQVALKQMLVVLGDGVDSRGDHIVRINYDELVMREDTPRNASGVADLRYRPMYSGWSTTLHIRVIRGQIDMSSLVALVEAAGAGGVGEWRPTSPKSATGSYGTFQIDASRLDDLRTEES
jgi:hypothetical protein